MRHILSIDVEEYFHVQAASEAGVDAEDWAGLEHRLPASVDRLLALLDETDTIATFFVLGWVARHEPALVRRVVEAGHEIASHSMGHRMLASMTAEAFRQDLRDSRHLLQDLSGQAVVGYRAPTFSITRESVWALDVLAEEGFDYDASIFPVRHDRYGIVGAPRWPHVATGPAGGRIVELPPLTGRMLGINVPVGGGGYLRLLPTWLVRLAIAAAARAGQPAVLYLHPWELDPDQPKLPMGPLSRIRHRVGLRRTEAKLRRLLAAAPFTSIRQWLAERPDVRKQPPHRYGCGG